MQMLKNIRIVLVLFLVALALSGASDLSRAGSPDFVQDRIAFGDKVKAIVVQGDYGYVLYGLNLSILDISNPVHVAILGSIEASGIDLVVEEDYAYIITGASLRIANISNPYFPTLMADIRIRSFQNTVAYHDGYVYIGSYGLSIVDVTDPKSPREVSFFNRNLGEINKVIVAPDPTGESERVYAYLATTTDVWWRGGGLIIVDVTDPTNPQHADPSCDDGCGWANFGRPDLTMQDQYTYLTFNDEDDPNNFGIEVKDVSDPALPVLVTHFHTPDTPTYKVAVQGEEVYATGVALNENDREVLLTVDVAEKSQPRQAGLRDMTHTRAQGGGIVAAGECLYIPQGEAGLEILCETNVTPTPPKLSFLPLFSWFGG